MCYDGELNNRQLGYECQHAYAGIRNPPVRCRVKEGPEDLCCYRDNSDDCDTLAEWLDVIAQQKGLASKLDD